jgi:hypothetical protein
LVLSGSLALTLTLLLVLETTGQMVSAQHQAKQSSKNSAPLPPEKPFQLEGDKLLDFREDVEREFLPIVLRRYHSSVNSTSADLNCRYGVAGWGAALENAPSFASGWYLTFSAGVIPPGPSDAEFVQVIRVRQNKDDCTYLEGYSTYPNLTDTGLGKAIDANPGSLWIVGNEPDRAPSPPSCTAGAQDDTYPEVYAQAYHEVYHYIKQRDPTAQVAIAGLVQVTPGRLQYLDKVWETYLQEYDTTMPVDVWNMHLYILPEASTSGQPNGIANIALGTDPALAVRESGGDPQKCSIVSNNVYCFADHDNLAIFADQIVKMRTWMKEHGQQNKPLILSEYSLLYHFEDYDDPVNPTTCWVQDEYGGCFTAARVSNFMTRTFSYLENATDPNLGYPLDNNRLVQQWLWFSLYYTGAGKVSSLLHEDLVSLTQAGQTFSSTVNALPTHTNLLPIESTASVAFTPAPSNSVTVTLSVDVYNNGNTCVSNPITVSFYSDAALSQMIGTTVITETLGGCARRMATASTDWENLTEGVHRYWVQVSGDSPGYEGDNIIEAFVLVNPGQVFLPITMRQW